MRKGFVVVLFIVGMIASLTSCDRQGQECVPEKTEYEKVEKIKKRESIDTYDLKAWNKIYYLGIEGQLVLLEKSDDENSIITVALADDPNTGNNVYEEVNLEKGTQIIGAGEYIRVKDGGVEYGVKTENNGQQIKKEIFEMSEEEIDFFIHYTHWKSVEPQPESTTK